MAKILKKKFFEVEIPILNEKYELLGGSIDSFDKKTIKMDITRKLKGKSVDLILQVSVKEGKMIADPKKLLLLPSFIKHMMHGGISYVEDSIQAKTKESEIIIKPFLITRKKVSRAVRRTLRNSTKNFLEDYLKEKTDYEVFDDILSNQLQKNLSLKLKKIYPLAICEIRAIEVKNSLTRIEEKPKAEKEIKVEDKKDIEASKNLGALSEEKPKKKSSKSKKEIKKD